MPVLFWVEEEGEGTEKAQNVPYCICIFRKPYVVLSAGGGGEMEISSPPPSAFQDITNYSCSRLHVSEDINGRTSAPIAVG